MNMPPETRADRAGGVGSRAGKPTVARRRPGAGRRRDPTIDDKIRHAARILYAADGWAGFHFDGVAKAAEVSKDAVYRRYPSREALLLDALTDQTMPSLASAEPIEEALVTYAIAIFDYLSSGDGLANLRIHLDGSRYPEVLIAYQEQVVEPSLARDVDVVRNAVDSGELPPTTDCRAVITALSGALLVFTLSRQHGAGDRARSTAIRRIREIVHQIVHGTRLPQGP